MAAPASARKGLSHTTKVTLWVLGGLVVLAGVAYGTGYALAGEKLPANASISGVAVGGLSPEEAASKLNTELKAKAAEKIALHAGTESTTVSATQAGLSLDIDASIERAGGGARSFNPVAIVSVLFGGLPEDAVVSVDEATLAAVIAGLAEKVDVDPVDATLAYVKGKPVTTEGTVGRLLQRDKASDLVRAAFLKQSAVDLPVETAEPAITTAEAQAVASGVATTAISDPVKVAVPDHGTMLVEPEVILESLSFPAVGGTLTPTFDAKALGSLLEGEMNGVGLAEPTDARFTIKKGGKPKVVASKDGAGVDTAALATALAGVLDKSGGQRTVSVPVIPRKASFTTEDAKAMGVKQVTGQFTTYFPGSAYRYNNIGKAAKLVNGTYLAPGETFSMNAALGERTAKAGWMQGGGIANGRIDPSIYGGGISQATTTVFNAIFFAGLEDVYHKPHSLYFSRYPVGREATLDWRMVDMKFKNNTEHGVLLQAWTTGRTGSQGSVTVKVWSTKKWTIKSSKPVRSNYRAPGARVYDTRPGCNPQSAMSGFDVSYYREFYQGKKLEKREKFFWAYNSLAPVTCGKKPSAED